MNQLWSEGLRLWNSLGRRQQIALVVLMVGMVAVLVVFAIWAGQPEYATAYTNLSEQDAAAIVQQLQKQQIPYQLTGDGTTIRVPSNRVYQVRLDMARQGLPKGGAVGFELFDGGNLSSLAMTDFAQRINYQRALEGELSRTIGGLDAVEQARVHLVIPEKTLFSEQAGVPTASVVLRLRTGRKLSEEQIWSIGNLVASSVEGLQPENVTIVDVNGRLLAEGAAGDTRAARSGPRLTMAQLAAQRDFAQDLENRLQQMLDRTLGSGKAVVRATVMLDWAQVETTKESYNPSTGDKAGVVRSAHEVVERQATGGTAGGVPGTSSNLPPLGAVPSYQGVLTDTTGGPYVRHEATVNYEVNKTVERQVNSPGTVKRLSVAVLLDSSIDPARMTAIEEMMASAAGIDRTRGDTITVDTLTFESTAAQDKKALEEQQRWSLYMDLARIGAALLGLALVLWFLRRSFKRLEARVPTATLLPPAPEVAQLPTPLQIIGEEEMAEELELDLEDIRRRKRVEELAKSQPEVVARVIQRWLAEKP